MIYNMGEKVNMQWVIMAVMVLFFAGYIGTTYTSIKDSSYYFYIAATYGIMSQVVWAFAAKRIEDKNFLYFYANVWDAALVTTGALLPLAFGVQMKPIGYIGLILIGVGLCVLKKAL